MEAKKRTWQTPELTVLVRSRTEEAVLAGCKTVASLGGPSTLQTNCTEAAGGSATCKDCKNSVTS